jgi:hypothetical protein
MAYSERFVMSILVNGRSQPESPDGSITIPFGCEYIIRFKNQHRDRRAVVKLFIDGTEMSKGGYVVPPRSFKDIERNSYSPKRFKFVAPDSRESEAAGKDTINTEGFNGVIEARFYLEKEQPKVEEVHHHHHHHHDHYPYVPPRPYPWWAQKHTLGGATGSSIGDYDMETHAKSINTLDSSPTVTCSVNAAGAAPTPPPAPASMGFASADMASAAPAPAPLGEDIACFKRISIPLERRSMKRETVAGVTVEGGYSSQTFRAVAIELEEQCTVVKLLLKGYHPDPAELPKVVEEGVVVPDDEVTPTTTVTAYCPNCGAGRKPPKANFCHVCGHKYE